MIRALLPAALLLTGLASSPALSADAAKDGVPAAATRDLYLTLIRQARSDGRPRAAIAYLDDFERRYPNDRDAQVLRVNCLLDLDQVSAARTALGRIPNGDRSGPVLAVRGHVLAAEGQWGSAATQYAAALQASPADAFTANALGYAQLRSGQGGAAVETLRSALDLAPDDAVVRNNLMLALTVTGRVGEAEAMLARVTDAGEKARLRQQLTGEAARIAAAGSGMTPRGS